MSGNLMEYRAYFDCSGNRSSSSALTVTAFVAQVPNWERFASSWSSHLARKSISAFHMTDFMAGAPEFNQWRDDRSRHGFLQELVATLQGYVQYTTSSTVLLEPWRELDRQFAMRECHVSPYGLASFSVIGKCVTWFGAHHPNDRLRFCSERGDGDRGDREHLLRWMRDLARGRLDGLVVEEGHKGLPALQAADLSAWIHRVAVSGDVAHKPGRGEIIRQVLRELMKLDGNHGVMSHENLAEHRELLQIPERREWKAWSSRQKASWRPASFASGTLYPAQAA